MYKVIADIFETVANNFYREGIKVQLSEADDTAHYNIKTDTITLPIPLLETFTKSKLPRFTVFYHELGHALYTAPLHNLISKWKNLPAISQICYEDKYFHLLNWIEDFYIETQLVKNYPFLTDIVGCLKRVTFNYNLDDLDKAFNHYYIKGYSSPALSSTDGLTFVNYITSLLTCRDKPFFGAGAISLLSRNSTEATFIRTLIDFYNFCVNLGIFPNNVDIPPLSLPTNILKPSNQPVTNQHQANTPKQNSSQGATDNAGSSSDHSHLVLSMKEVFPDVDASSTSIFIDQFVAEQKMIKEELANRSKVEASETSLDGLFNCTYKDTSIIQSKVIVPNFFNPNRLIDNVLFKTPNKVFNNVSIYRDISGSTEHNDIFPLINSICDYLTKNIPIATNFYLYCSGHVSILETVYEDWDDWNKPPSIYANDEVFQQFGGGTNSGAIADVITEQLSDKWLNIVVTDGDLCDLMRRQNINSLLENIFVIAVSSDCNRKDIASDKYIFIEDESQIPLIASKLVNMRGD